MSRVKPAMKLRYLRTGLEIVGDHKQAREAHKVFEYYQDLLTEIKLDAKIDGTDIVGHKRPFGVFVSLRHTREIEGESGGFGRYLQNQNNSRSYYYNYGRPLENYRDKFEEIVRQSLDRWMWILVTAGVVVPAGLAVVFKLRKGAVRGEETPRFQMPEKLTAFTVLGLLRHIQKNNGLDESGQKELDTSITRLESYYFVNAREAEPDLKQVAETWIQKTTR